MGYLDLVRDVLPRSSPVIPPVQQDELNERNELSLAGDLEPLYDQLRAIYDRDDFDSPAMLAERSRLDMEIHRKKHAGQGRIN